MTWADLMKERIRELRNDFNMSVIEFGDQLGVNRNTIYAWEEKNAALPRLVDVANICITFGVSADWLMFGRGKKWIKANR